MRKKGIFNLSLLILLFPFFTGMAFSQTVSKEEKPQIAFGDITYKIREIESAPSPLKTLEVYIEVLNRSRSVTASSNSIKVVMVQKEMRYAMDAKPSEFSPPPQEALLNIPIPPLEGRVLIIGFPLPGEKLESITLEVQMNPPEGEKKTLSVSF